MSLFSWWSSNKSRKNRSATLAQQNRRNFLRNSRSLRMEQLEGRALLATIVVTGVGDIGISTDTNVRVEQVDFPPTGTGVIQSFLRIQHKPSEEGYNTSFRGSPPSQYLLDAHTDIFTRDLKLADVPLVNIEGTDYREFRLDLNESGEADESSAAEINFSHLQFFTSSSGGEYLYDGATPTLGNATLRYDLETSDVNGDDFTLRDRNSGSGSLDYLVYVKDSVFSGAAAGDYVYLYSAFGSPTPESEGGFEEWAVQRPDDNEDPQSGGISGTKWNDLDGDVETTADRTTGFGGFTIFVDVNGNGLNDDGFSDVTLPDGSYSIGSIPAGTYNVYEVAQDGYTVLIGSQSVTVIDDVVTENVDFVNFKNIEICGIKFYDVNTDGDRDAGEVLINGWNFGLDTNGDTVVDVIATTGGGEDGVLGDDPDTVVDESADDTNDGSFCFTNLGPGTYTVYELVGLSGTWVATTSTVAGPFDASSGTDVTTHDFGNVKLGEGGGLTLGFWSNKNGEKTMNGGSGMTATLAMLSNLNLRNADGSNFDPSTYKQFRTWILSATATNMSYMLSAQLAAMELNVYFNKVDGSALIYAPGTTSANLAGFATVNAVMAEANTELGLHGLVLASSPYRAYQESLKNALDNANNNLNFVIGLSSWNDANGNGVIDEGEI